MSQRRFFARPGVFIFVVAVFVFAGAATLWSGMLPLRGEGAKDRSVVSHANAASTDANVTRMLVDVANMAYEEPLAAPLEDGVKQADFALVQAMLRGNVQLEEAVIEKTELRHDAQGAYNFQRIRMNVGKDALPFVNNLDDSLRAWVDNAQLVRSHKTVAAGESLWTIAVNGVVTHELLLTSGPVAPQPTTEGPGRIFRRRAPGTPARLVIVIDDLGEDMGAARTLANLPFPVTFAVWPHSSHARRAAEVGHAAGREIIVHQPTEPMKYPEVKPGPKALFTSLSDGEIEARVIESMKIVPHAVGMNNHMGSRFTRDRRGVAAMIRPLKRHGFFVLDSVTHPGSVLYAEARRNEIPTLKRDIFLDAVHSKANALRQLRRAEDIALMTGSAVAIGHPLPETLAALKEWNALRNTEVHLVRLADLLALP